MVIVTEDTYSVISAGVAEKGSLLFSETVFMESAFSLGLKFMVVNIAKLKLNVK